MPLSRTSKAILDRRLPIPETDPDPRFIEIDDVVPLVAPSHIVE